MFYYSWCKKYFPTRSKWPWVSFLVSIQPECASTHCSLLLLSYETETNKYSFVSLLYVIATKWGTLELKIKVRNWKWSIHIYCIYIVHVVETISSHSATTVNNDWLKAPLIQYWSQSMLYKSIILIWIFQWSSMHLKSIAVVLK